MFLCLQGKGEGISITPLPAGHMIGAAMWKIVKGEEDVVYAVDFNHKRERHLNGCDLDKISRPSLLITDAYNANLKQLKRAQRDEALMTNILQTLRSGGNVLIAVDTAGRVLELAHMLEQLWQNRESGLLAYSLALLNHMSYNVIEFAKSQIEWMSDKLMRSFDRQNPFNFRHLKLCHSAAELDKVPAPKVVLASTPDLESGFSRLLFLQWAADPKNSIVLTSAASKGSLAHDLMTGSDDGRLVRLNVAQRVKLSGAELEEHLRQSQQLPVDADDASSSEDEAESHDIIMKTSGTEEGSVQQKFFKSTKSKYLMFPFHEERLKWDDYGEVIKPEDWMDSATDVTAASVPMEELPAPLEKEREVPTKCVSRDVQLQVKAQVRYIDFEGKADGESVYRCITKMRPRRVILVRGGAEESKTLGDACTSFLEEDARVFTPVNGQVVDATTETHIYQVRLTDALMSQLHFRPGKDQSLLAWVDGYVSHEAGKEDVKHGSEEEEEERIPTLEPTPEEEITGHNAIFVNELKLSDFKMVLLKHNINSEFQGGVLFCGANSQVALRRHDSGRVTIEGCLCEDYYLVRNLLYQQYAIV